MKTAEDISRIGIVGASSLLGKELADALNDSALAASEIALFDDEEAAGRIAAAGDEAAVIQPVEETSFERMDYVFFAGSPETTRRVWTRARQAGAGIVDLTCALEHEPDVLVRAPWIAETTARDPDLKTSAVVSAHPAAIMLALAAARLRAALPLAGVAATVMMPASEHGRAAMDELHQQTVSLLSFQSLPRELYDAQAAFNLLPALGSEARVRLDAIERRIGGQFALLIGERPPLALQAAQAPVFHGCVISAFARLEEAVSVARAEEALAGEHVEVATSDAEPPSNLSVAGKAEILARVKSARPGQDRADGIWLWMAADNLKLAAINAIACAGELGRLRPRGKVQ